ncbi:unnamed protein product [Heterobilharzia americana]|nr:unnamed protein product [Heterobilharzia americana]
MGMITTNVLEESLSFGPLPTSLMIGEPAYLIAQTTTDRLSELPTIYADPKRLSDPIRLIEWVCNLRCARCPGEQNMELICSNRLGQSFYRTTRRIEAGEELLIWFRRQDLQPLLSEHLNNVHISEAWFGQTVKSANSHHKDYEELENGYSKRSVLIIINSNVLSVAKLCVMPNIQLINQPPISNEYSNEMTNKFSHQQNTDYSLVTNTKDEGRSNRMENILLKNDPSPLILESLPTEVISSSFCSSSVTDMKYNKREEFQCKINDFDQIYDPSNKTMISFHKKYLHKIRSNNKMLLNFKTKQNTPNNHIDDSQGIYRKSKLKNNVLPLKTRNPLVEQLYKL